jgi:hypothetical protein
VFLSEIDIYLPNVTDLAKPKGKKHIIINTSVVKKERKNTSPLPQVFGYFPLFDFSMATNQTSQISSQIERSSNMFSQVPLPF